MGFNYSGQAQGGKYSLQILFNSILLIFIHTLMPQETHLSSELNELSYTALFDALPGTSVLVQNNAPRFTIMAATPAYLKQTGFSREAIIGKGVFDAFPVNTDPSYSGGEELLASYLHVANHKHEHFIPVQRYDLMNEDGSFTEKYWRISNKPVFAPDGEVIFIIHTSEDITAEIRSEKREAAHQELQKAFNEVEESEASLKQFRFMADHAQDPFILIRQDGTFAYLNKKALETWGYTEEEAGKIRVPDVDPTYNDPVFSEAFDRAQKEAIPQFETVHKRKDGSIYPVEVNMGGLSLNGKPHLFAVARDITERNKVLSDLHYTREKSEQQKRLYETITANTPDLVFVLDLSYHFVFANEALLEMWGKTYDEAIGKGLEENGYEPWHAEKHRREIDEVVAERKALRGEASFPHAKLGTRIYDYILVPVINHKGEVEAVVGTTRDITEIKKAEASLRQSEQRQSLLLRLNDHLRTLTDPSEIQYEAAQMVAQYLEADRVGYAEDNRDGSSVSITMDYTNNVPSLRGRYSYNDYGPELLQAFREGRTVIRNDISTDPSLSEPEKAAHALLQLGATVNVPLLRNGELIAIFFMHFREAHQWTKDEVSFMQEVAGRTWEAVQRARTEQALRESEERFRLISNAVPLSMWIADTEGRTEFLNKHWCDYCGEPYTDTTASDIAQKYIHPEDAPRVLLAFENAMRLGEPFEVEQRNLSKEGLYRWFLNRATPYRDPVTGSIVKWFGTGIDIHDRKLAEQALRQSEEMLEKKVVDRTMELEKVNQELLHSNQNLEEFAYAASHDLKEPIRKIHFFTDRLKECLKDKLQEEESRYFERLETSAKRMSTLIDDLLLYSHISRGAIRDEVVDLNDILVQVVDDLELRIQEKGARIVVEPLPRIRGHQRQLQQLFENLLGNALKYGKSDTKPEILISSRKIDHAAMAHLLRGEKLCEQYWLIEVQDNGIGFSQEDAEIIFNVFTRLHGMAEYKGTGVGLSIVRKVVENHGGIIWAESVPGQGSSFKLLLPVT